MERQEKVLEFLHKRFNGNRDLLSSGKKQALSLDCYSCGYMCMLSITKVQKQVQHCVF